MEFGPKLDVSLSEGIARVECVSFDAYHEGCIAIAACERYRQRHGCYPAKVLVDRAYLSRANRRYFRACGIRYVAKPQGRPPKDAVKLAAYEEAMAQAECPGERNPIEGWFGLAKRRYRLGRLRCRRAETTIGEVFLIAMAVNLASELARVSTALFAATLRALTALVASGSLLDGLESSWRTPRNNHPSGLRVVRAPTQPSISILQ